MDPCCFCADPSSSVKMAGSHTFTFAREVIRSRSQSNVVLLQLSTKARLSAGDLQFQVCLCISAVFHMFSSTCQKFYLRFRQNKINHELIMIFRRKKSQHDKNMRIASSGVKGQVVRLRFVTKYFEI